MFQEPSDVSESKPQAILVSTEATPTTQNVTFIIIETSSLWRAIWSVLKGT